VEVIGRKPFGGPLAVRVGTAGRNRELDLGDEAALALWVFSDKPHAGCALTA
jgi:DtxR family Mn-dependent transcriptional regulator